jgi:hypothetical protein
VQRELEYRAQLVSLASSPDPRVPLSDVLFAAENGVGGATPHAGAYRRLLADFLVELDVRLAREPDLWPELDPHFALAHQLHHLGPERVREVALALAKRHGLTGR